MDEKSSAKKKDVKCKSTAHFAKEVFDFIKSKGECIALALDIESFFTNLDHTHLKKAWAELLGKKTLPKDHYNIYKSITRYSYIRIEQLKDYKGQFDEALLAQNRKKGVDAFFDSPKSFREAIKEGRLNVYKNQRKNKQGQLIGIPQGLPISAMLANLYLLEFDKFLQKEVEDKRGGLYRRYSDDIAIICDEVDRKDLLALAIDKIKEYKLKIAESKTEVCLFKYELTKKGQNLSPTKLMTVLLADGRKKKIKKPNFPFRYLGFEFYGDKTLIKSANISKFYRRAKSAIKSKVRRKEQYEKKYLVANAPLYKRKLYRLYTPLGRKSRKLDAKACRWEYNDLLGIAQPKIQAIEKKYRGNHFKYVWRAAEIMESPAIKRQYRRYWRNFKKYLEEELEKSRLKE